MSKINSDLATRCELALMGRVVTLNNEEVDTAVKYMCSAMSVNGYPTKVLSEIQRWSENEVSFVVCNTIQGMRCITFLLSAPTEDEESEEYYPAPFKEDYGTGYPCAFSYVRNLDCPDCSEFGDTFYRKDRDGFYHRVS